MITSTINEQKNYMEKVKELNKNGNKKYYIFTMGCTLNENDSEKICGMLTEMNYTGTTVMQEADFIIFNTCCIRENAEDKLFGKLGEAKRVKEKRGALIAIGGCMMQQEHIISKIKTSYPFVDILFGTHTLHKLPEDVYKKLNAQKQVTDIVTIDGEVFEGLPIKRSSNTKALVTIMYGCNNFCTYCIVPYVRGRERSRLPEDILKEIKGLAAEGYKEVTLLGQNVNSYKGNGYKNINNFADLLREIDKIDGINIINFISPHPKDFSDDVIQAIKESKKISRILHLPLQSGSSSVLKRMNRKYTKEQYLDLADKIKKEIPEITFSTDIIVGFPGETEEDFKDTLDVVRQVQFEQVFMFIYSVRVGTPAEKMDNHIPEDIKHERFSRLQELVEGQIEINNKKYLNTKHEILVEGVSKNNEKMLTGRTATNKIVIFEGDNSLIGKIVDINIISEHKWYLRGEIIK